MSNPVIDSVQECPQPGLVGIVVRFPIDGGDVLDVCHVDETLDADEKQAVLTEWAAAWLAEREAAPEPEPVMELGDAVELIGLELEV